MSYLAVTGGTASWLLGKPGLMESLFKFVIQDVALQEQAREREFVEGSIRISTSSDASIVALWNVDYLGGTGDDGWGLIDISAEAGLCRRPGIGVEVFERALYVISQRMQGLLIEGAFIHRALDNDTHTCLAGRGNEARQVSIGYLERDILIGSIAIHTVLVRGPEYDFIKLREQVGDESEHLVQLVQTAKQLYDPGRKKLSLPDTSFPELRRALSVYVSTQQTDEEYSDVNVTTDSHPIADRENYRTAGWSYAQWLSESSPLSSVQRRILLSDAVEKHPIRIIGPGGSGKTLLMQLLAVRRLEVAREQDRPVRILYLVHNAKMAETVRHRFSVLLNTDTSLCSVDRTLEVLTLSEYGKRELYLDESQIIDPDAHQAKQFQLDILRSSLVDTIAESDDLVQGSPLFREVKDNEALLPVLTRLVMIEISTAIKGHGLINDERRYAESERALSRLHGVLKVNERRVIYAAYRRYHETVFDGYGVLDSDDIAISLLGKLRTPIWELKRRQLGFDHVFVDEAQLFNENERRLLPLLTRGLTSYVPVILALDQAQDLYGQTTAGLGTLGIEGMASESLQSIHRSSRDIIRLAFFIIQRSTDLFGPDFPKFTGIAESMAEDISSLIQSPRVETIPHAQREYGRFILKRIRALRKANLRRIAVVCMAEQYWQPILDELAAADLPLHILENRGERLHPTDPVVILSRPAHIGGQEFDAVLIAGAELGLVPPRVLDNDALASAVEQQALRELYLSITRARYRLVFTLSREATLSSVLADAQRAGLIETSHEESA